MRTFTSILIGLVLLGATAPLRAEDEARPTPDLAAWAVGRWETADANGNPWLWFDLQADGRYRLSAVHHWMDATYRVEGGRLFMRVTAGNHGPQDEIDVGFKLGRQTLALGAPGGGEGNAYTRVGRPGEAGSLVGVWSRPSPDGTWYLRFTAEGTMHGRVPQKSDAGEHRYAVEGSTLALSRPAGGKAMRFGRDDKHLVTGEGAVVTRFRRLDVPWYRAPGPEPAPLPVGSWTYVKDGELEGWTFVFDADGYCSMGVAHQAGFSGYVGRWRWEDDVVVMGEVREPGTDAPPASANAAIDEAFRLRVKPLDDNAMEVRWLEPMGKPGDPGWRYERTTCPKSLVRAWETRTDGATHVLDLRAHHDFEFRTSRSDADEDEVRRGEWHVWSDRLWMTFPASGGFGEWRVEQPSPDELTLTSRGGRKLTYRPKAP